MLLNISTTHQPATDLGFLLHKHPDKFQTIELSVGKAHIFYPEANEARTTVSLLLDIDPVDMVRGARNLGGEGFALGHYVNDRLYVASSFMSVALSKAFSSALNGKCKDKPELVTAKLPLEAMIAVLPAPNGGESLIRKLFEPLGYEVSLERHILDAKFPEWGESKYFTVYLKNTLSLQTLLSHLYVLIPALDQDKHYFVDENEVEKLFQKGGDWLKNHPEKEQIIRRYLLNFKSLTRQAIERLSDGIDETDDTQEVNEAQKYKSSLHDKRLQIVAQQLVESGAKSVLDVGCGEGKLIRLLLKHPQFGKIAGMDVSYQELLRAKERLRYNELPSMQKERLLLFQGSLMYQDARLEGFDAAAVVEVIEHLEPNRLEAFEHVLFGCAKPQKVFLTTPNQEYNVMWETLSAGAMRHNDHRFEWTRQEFASWASRIGETYGYQVRIVPLGDEVENIGAPSQMAIFRVQYGN